MGWLGYAGDDLLRQSLDLEVAEVDFALRVMGLQRESAFTEQPFETRIRWFLVFGLGVIDHHFAVHF